MRIYVGGINGVGKSTLLKAASERSDYTYIHATTGLLESLGFGKDYEKLRALTQTERDIRYGHFIEKLLNGSNHNFLLDAHYLGLVRGKIDRVTDSWIKDFDAFALISAPFDDIWRRIQGDAKTRDRALFPKGISEQETKNMLMNYRKQTSDEVRRLATLHKKPFIEILNEENRLEEAINHLITNISSMR